MTLQQLRYFCVMAEVLHYTKAADQLYISQPSLSYSLAELEKELGVPLFEKQGKRTFLTRYGESFLPYAQNALKAISSGEAMLLHMSDPTKGHINLGYIYSVGFDLLPRIVERFYLYQGNRNISFNFTQGMSSQLMERLLDGSLDFVFTTRPNNALIDALPIFKQELYLALPNKHHLSRKPCVSLEEVKDEQFISINPNTSLRMQLDNYFKEAGISPKVMFEVDECNSMAAFVSAQLGIAIMPRIPSLSSYNVSLVPICKQRLKRDICLLWKKNHHIMPSAQCFKSFVEHTQAFDMINHNNQST